MKKVEVTWVDTYAQEDIDLKDLETKSVCDFLYTRTTLGWLYKEDKDGVLLIQDKGQDDKCEICAIPKRMLVSIK